MMWESDWKKLGFADQAAWLDSLKPGDVVAWPANSWSNRIYNYTLHRVARVMKSRVELEGRPQPLKRRRSGLLEIDLQPVTAEVRRVMARYQALKLLESVKWQEKSDDFLNKVATAVEAATEAEREQVR